MTQLTEAASVGGPLEGLRVIEFGGLAPTPHAAMMLADLGAEVVRIERPGSGGQPETDPLWRGRPAIEIDIKTAGGLTEVRELICAVDVLIEPFRPGVMERLGIGPEECADLNDRLIYARMTGWGRSGPLADTAGHDINYIALTGMLNAIGREDDAPVVPLNLLGDFGGGSMFLLVGILAALWERMTSGRGQVVDAAMVDGVSVLGQMVWSLRGRGRWDDRRGTNVLDAGAPYYRVYECADGRYVAVGAVEPRFYAELVELMNLESTPPDRDLRANWPAIQRAFAGRFKQETRDDWVRTFAGSDACVTPVLSFVEATQHEHIRARETLITVSGVSQAAPAPRFSRTPCVRPDLPRPESPVKRWLHGDH